MNTQFCYFFLASAAHFGVSGFYFDTQETSCCRNRGGASVRCDQARVLAVPEHDGQVESYERLIKVRTMNLLASGILAFLFSRGEERYQGSIAVGLHRLRPAGSPTRVENWTAMSFLRHQLYKQNLFAHKANGSKMHPFSSLQTWSCGP